jgi:hypothetical protein
MSEDNGLETEGGRVESDVEVEVGMEREGFADSERVGSEAEETEDKGRGAEAGATEEDDEDEER